MNQKKEKENSIKKVLLKDMPNLLAYGVPGSGGELVKTMETKRWNMRAEKEIGELLSKNKNITISFYTAMILGNMCTRLGSHNFEKSGEKPEMKALLINNMYMGDVYTAWLQLRLSALGPIMDLEINCPFCGNNNPLPANLDTVEVVTVESIEDLHFDYDLLEPIEIHGKKVTGFKFGPPRWGAMDLAGSNANLGSAKAAVIANSVVETKGVDHQIAITTYDLDEMGKRDYETITRKIGENRLGPDMSVELECSQCKKEIMQPIDWTYNNFFSISSQ